MVYEVAEGQVPAKTGEMGGNAPFLRQLRLRVDSFTFAVLRLDAQRAPNGTELHTILSWAKTARCYHELRGTPTRKKPRLREGNEAYIVVGGAGFEPATPTV